MMNKDTDVQNNEKHKMEDQPVDFRFVYILGISLISALGGFLFGYDWVVIGGAKPFFINFFHISSPSMVGWAVSNALVGCLVGAALSGYLTDSYGRRKVLVLAGFMFLISAIGTAYSQTFVLFVWARIVGGIGIGLASNVSPMYIAEISPAKYRGKLVSINQLTIVLGILAAQIANWVIAQDVSSAGITFSSWNVQIGWRWMFGAEAFPALAFFLAAFFVPESPRWLMKEKFYDQAESVLKKIGGSLYAGKETDAIRESLETEKQRESLGVKELWQPYLLPIILLGVGLAFFQQWSGINVIFNYAEDIFKSAGYSINDLFFQIIITGTINLIFTLVGMQMVDQWGRKKLLLLGSGGLFITYMLMAFFYYTNIVGFHMLLLVLIAIALYAMSLAPVTWVVLSEIYPNRIRGAAMSVSVFALWLGSLTLTYTFPILNNLAEGSKGTAVTFGMYGVICIIGFSLIKVHLPETMGKSLEELEKELIQ